MFLPANITLQFGDSGDFVAELQRRLAAISAHPEAGINGFFDGVTVNSVSSFQSRVGIRADGIAGPETLRRLNGVISGDTSTTDTKAEEEEKQRAAAAAIQLQQLQALEQQQAMNPASVSVGEAVLGTVAVGGLAAAVMAEVSPVSPSQAPQSLAQDIPQIQQQLQREAQLQQMYAQQPQTHSAPAPNAGDLLAQMLLQQTAPLQQPQHAPQQQPQHTPAMAQPLHIPTPHTPAPAALQTPMAEAEQAPRGVVGQAIQKMSALVQKLAEYFEAKLPPDVLHEVKLAGQVMAQNGVKEVAMPAGPEQTRAPSAPARGPDQQQIPQRG